MKIVFMGTPDFAAVSLERLYADGHEILSVYTQPDKARKRGMKVVYTPVKELALAHGTPVFQPVSLREESVVSALRDTRCDLIAVVAYGKLLPGDMLTIPPLGCINIHGSLLPKYRGAAPVHRAVLNGDTETGVTSQYMTEEIDAGDILLTKKTAIGKTETAEDLYNRLGALGAALLSETIDALSLGIAVRVPQNSAEATYAPSLTKDMSPIDWTRPAVEIERSIRGLQPWPVATAQIGGIVCKVFSAEIVAKSAGEEPGTIVFADRSGIAIACADAVILIRETQAPGGRRMTAAEYLRGHPAIRSLLHDSP